MASIVAWYVIFFVIYFFCLREGSGWLVTPVTPCINPWLFCAAWMCIVAYNTFLRYKIWLMLRWFLYRVHKNFLFVSIDQDCIQEQAMKKVLPRCWQTGWGGRVKVTLWTELQEATVSLYRPTSEKQWRFYCDRYSIGRMHAFNALFRTLEE